jgi:phosphotransferase system  glucose/maltose/N-acetylglucosamine-specific IIC component
MVPALAGTGLLLYGLWQMSDFQKQERPWLNALDRAKLLGLVNFGLCPFLYWQNKMPGQPFFNAAVFVLVLSALLFLFNVNVVLKQLGAMLPDETLRHETLLFTTLDRWLLVGLVLLGVAYAVFLHSPRLQMTLGDSSWWLDRLSFWALTFFALLPLAMTMALIWKTKQVILDSVFGMRH